MSETNPADLALALQEATEGFKAIVDWPTDNDLIKIRQLLAPVLMKTKYYELTLTHILSTMKQSKRMPQELKYIAPKASMKHG